MKLERAFFDRDPVSVARGLLGCVLVHMVDGERRTGRIVETEAYLVESDAAAHTAYGKKAAWRAMGQGPGTLYIHPMRQYVGLDMIAKDGCVLVRGLEPLEGISGVLNGPAKLTRAMGIPRAYDGGSVLNEDSALWVEYSEAVGDIVAGPRVGITRDVELPLRFRLI
ncbi:MAG: 3-methyladenine DNA glycosylase [Blastochloris viridis]|uniref:Putative 3-methyladenine DNA glycosylase n=1 Tax=Blastochloris viridis TaxID=1079 RepID=A0A6N4RBY3_BLAVI|nr:MAG: 3-methyladenine DNA glycosylase [Blastochloris viridis]